MELHDEFNVIPVLDYRHGGDLEQLQAHRRPGPSAASAASATASSSSVGAGAGAGIPSPSLSLSDPYYLSAVLDRECRRDHALRQLILTRQVPRGLARPEMLSLALQVLTSRHTNSILTRQVPTVETIFYFIQVLALAYFTCLEKPEVARCPLTSRHANPLSPQGIKYRSGYPAPCDIIAFTYLCRLVEGSAGLAKLYLTAQVRPLPRLEMLPLAL